MKLSLGGRFSRRELLGSLRVAIAATILLGVSYFGVVAILDVVVATRLTNQVDRQLTERLEAAKANPYKAFLSAGVQTNGARYGLGIYGEPIALWAYFPDGHLDRGAPGDPLIEAGIAPPVAGGPTSLNAQIAGTTYRLQWLRTDSGWLLAGESLAELGHVEAILVLSEAIALPFLLAAFFFIALAIGLRSARPVEEARRRQLDFTADASHELRTPLSVIEAEASLTRLKPRSPAEYETALDRIGSESGRLRRIVDDLLWLARADSEPAPPAKSPTDLREAVSGSVERFGVVAAAQNQEIELVPEVESEGPLMVLAPPEWLDKLVGTLVDNACRHSGENAKIRLTALVLPGTSRVAVRVEDGGPGIPESERGEVVNRFKRATTVAGGHGLGLAIASSVVQGTGGKLTFATSELGGALVEASWPRWTGS